MICLILIIILLMNINDNPSYRARLPYNGFPISKSSFFTSTMGALYPTYWDFANPGDKYKFSAEMFVRTQNMVSPAFMKVRQVCRWFFVPLSQLYSPFGSIYYDINDVNSSLINVSQLQGVVPTGSTKDIVTSYRAASNRVDDTGLPYSYGFRALIELLHYSRSLIGDFEGDGNVYQVNPLLACAYQKIYNDKFRISDRQSPTPSNWNIDQFYNTDVTGNAFLNFLQIRYAPYDKDFFTNGHVQPLVETGDFSMLGQNAGSLSEVNNWLSINSLNATIEGNPSILQEKTVTGTSSTPSSGNPSNAGVAAAFKQIVSTSNIRSMFAVEKLAEITRRAAKHYDAQTLAHFGYDVPIGISGEVYEIGAQSIPVQMSDVAATATTDASVLGELSGRGNGYGTHKPFKFTAPCHGILMAISYCVPTACYDGSRLLARENTYRSRVDFYHPAFDRLGMQPLFRYQAQFNTADLPANQARILSWQYRYQELKQKFDASYGAFNTTRRSWVARRDAGAPFGNGSPLLPYIVPPTYLNGNMVVDFDGTLDTDPFNCCHTYHVSKSSVMSTYGLPKL